MSKRNIFYTTIIAILLVILVLILYFSPMIDMFVAKLFYDVNTRTFYGERHIWCAVIYWAIPVITTLIIIINVINLLFPQFSLKVWHWLCHDKLFLTTPNCIWYLRNKACIVLLALAIGPGLLANSVLKDHWGRPRPYQVLRNHEAFRPFWKFDLDSPKNNSFPCGHATIGFFLAAPFIARRKRKIGYSVGIIAGLMVGTVRILQGGHFVTDVIFSGLIIFATIEVVVYFWNSVLSRWVHKKTFLKKYFN